MTFVEFAAAHGLNIGHLKHGVIARCSTSEHRHKKNGAYLYNGNWGWLMDWATMHEPVYWTGDGSKNPAQTSALAMEMECARKEQAKRRADAQRKAAEKANWILGQCELDRHAYLDSKGFPSAIGNVWRREGQSPLLVIPMLYRGRVCGCQMIGIDGSKKFLSGQRTNNAVFRIGGNGKRFIVEGYASGLSLQAILASLKVKSTIHVCFSAGNVVKVARTLPDAIIVADNDVSGTGQRAAESTGLKWWMPPNVGQDINDLHRERGLWEASQVFRKFLINLG